MTANRVLIVLPAYDEGESVGSVLEEIRAALPGTPCLVVDDGSSDDTAVRAREAGATVLRLPFNLGVGGAMRAGFKYAINQGYDVVVQLDADGQHDPSEVAALIAGLDDADLVIGARFAGKGDYVARGPRRWAMRVLSTVIGGIAGQRLSDTTSGFKANGPRAIALFAVHYPAEYLGDTVEALVIAARGGLRIHQVPAAMRPRRGGTPSHRPLKAAVYLVRAFVALGFALIRPRVPVPSADRRAAPPTAADRTEDLA